ncbi:hypothetical protein CLF_103526, partial [Clonorchis sinensis]
MTLAFCHFGRRHTLNTVLQIFYYSLFNRETTELQLRENEKSIIFYFKGMDTRVVTCASGISSSMRCIRGLRIISYPQARL